MALRLAQDLVSLLIEAPVLLRDLLLELGIGLVHLLLEFFVLFLDLVGLVFLGGVSKGEEVFDLLK